MTHAEAVAQEGAAELGGDPAWLSDLLRREAAESVTDPDRLDRRLERLPRPEGSGTLADRVTALVLQSEHALRRGEGHRARTALRKALELAAPEAMRRPFRDGPVTAREALGSDPALLKQHPWLGMEPPRHASERSGWWPSQGSGQEATPEMLDGQVIEPLTPREHHVLGLLAELLTTEEIAATMFVSVNTVRTHIRTILRKLAVSRRNDAVRRARALSLHRRLRRSSVGALLSRPSSRQAVPSGTPPTHAAVPTSVAPCKQTPCNENRAPHPKPASWAVPTPVASSTGPSSRPPSW